MHYKGWPARHDEWLSASGDMLRALNEEEDEGPKVGARIEVEWNIGWLKGLVTEGRALPLTVTLTLTLTLTLAPALAPALVPARARDP